MNDTLVSFLNNFVAGVVSAICVLMIQWLYRLHRERKMFGSMEGEYGEIDLSSGESTGGIIKVRRDGATLLTAAGNKKGHVEWTGIINMNPLNPNVGEGTYHYDGKSDGGVHHVQRDPETGDLLVRGSNTTVPGGAEGWNMKWKPLRPRSGK